VTITIKRARKSVDIVTDLALQAQYEAAVEALDRARAEQQVALENSPGLAEAKVVTDLEKRMADSAITITLEALSNKVYNEIVATIPARDGDSTDDAYGLDISKADALIAPSIVEVTEKKSGKKLAFDPAKEWGPLADELSAAQWEQVFLAAYLLNKGVSKAPFSLAAFATTRTSERVSN